MLTQEKEAQDLTERVLNTKYTLDRLETQKSTLASEVKELEAKKVTLEQDNEKFQTANKDFEKILQDINEKILAKRIELDEKEEVYKQEIESQFDKIAKDKAEIVAREKEVSAREERIMKDEIINIEAQRNNEAVSLNNEQKEKQIAVREVEINRKDENINMVGEVLARKENDLNQKIAHNDEFHKSLLERETDIVGKYNTVSRREHELVQLKNAIENDRVNHENEKNRHQYVLKALEEIQVRCISNVGKTITEKVVDDIRSAILNQVAPDLLAPSIVDPDFLKQPEAQPVEAVVEDLPPTPVEEITPEDTVTDIVVPEITPEEVAPEVVPEEQIEDVVVETKTDEAEATIAPVETIEDEQKPVVEEEKKPVVKKTNGFKKATTKKATDL